MKVPVSWLGEYVDLSDLTPADLAERLTFSGVEVEGIATVGQVYDDAFVAAEVRAVRPHPGADRLTVCAVWDGAVEHTVVCGAPGVQAGDRACLARAGAVLPNGTRIRRTRIRGVESEGLLCAGDELGLSDDHSRLARLDASVAPGTPLRDVLPPPETVLELEITWNRPDCLSLIGIARELSALLRRPLRWPEFVLPEAGPAVATLARVRVEAPEACPRYVARVLQGASNGPSPAFLRRRLELCGVRPLGLIVDVTNYVMLECGQPLHAFDHERLAERTIVVRRARPGERMRTLDGVDRALDARMLLIADAREAVALAGVMGGAGSEISENTRSVLLESAAFAAPEIKRTATELGMRSESSHRFERGVDPDLPDWASRRAAALLAEHGGAVVAAGAIDADHRPRAPRRVSLRYGRARDVIGVELEGAQMRRLLEALGLKAESHDAERGSYEVPSWRGDLECEADLIEEVARLHGLAAIPDKPVTASVVAGADDAWLRAEAACRQALLGMGFTEALHYSFLSAAELDAWDPCPPAPRVALPNPVSSDYAVLRDSLLPQLCAALGRNMARQVETAALFEIGRVFRRELDGGFAEETRLAFGLCGPAGRSAYDRRRPVAAAEGALWVKGAVEAVAAAVRAAAPVFVACDHPACTPGWGAEIRLRDEAVGWLGLVRPELRHAWRVTSPLALAEVRLAPLLADFGRVARPSPAPPYPAVRRDLACLAPRSLSHAELAAAIRAAAPAELTAVTLFDIFESKEMGAERRSLAYALDFRSPQRTLTDDEVNAAVANIVRALQTQHGVEVRER